jgi:quercetin dioxygenase-like cupin family protein
MQRFLFALIILLLTVSLGSARTGDKGDYQRVESLQSGNQTVVGETITYPRPGTAQITTLIVTMEPGETTGWHKHGVPLVGYILEGEITTDYGSKGTRIFKKGDAFLEAMDWRHDARNSGETPTRILVVFIGAEGRENVVRDDSK